jgi:uroporphyrinogen-III synthase
MPDPVVITRPRAQAQALADSVAALGREAVLLPLLEIFPLSDQSALQRTLAGLADYALVAFVSPNAIDAAFAHIARWPDGVALAVLGETSRACLARHGVNDGNATIFSPLDPARSDSEHLLQALALNALSTLETLNGKRVLIVRGETGRELMADGLRAAGAQVDTVAAYRRQVPAMTAQLASTLGQLLARQNDWIITSSEAVRGLLGLVTQLGDAAVANMQQQHLIVPHARIAETANSLGLTRLTLAGSGDASLLAALQSRA